LPPGEWSRPSARRIWCASPELLPVRQSCLARPCIRHPDKSASLAMPQRTCYPTMAVWSAKWFGGRTNAHRRSGWIGQRDARRNARPRRRHSHPAERRPPNRPATTHHQSRWEGRFGFPAPVRFTGSAGCEEGSVP
jgi:hypothetical protein